MIFALLAQDKAWKETMADFMLEKAKLKNNTPMMYLSIVAFVSYTSLALVFLCML